MADKTVAKKLDAKLIKDGFIEETFKKDYEKVHNLLNKNVKKYDKALNKDNFKVGEQDLRNWLNSLYLQGASQEKLTNYLRCGLAHLCFDYIDLNTDGITKDEHITRALQSFIKRKYNKAYFKPSAR